MKRVIFILLCMVAVGCHRRQYPQMKFYTLPGTTIRVGYYGDSAIKEDINLDSIYQAKCSNLILLFHL